MHIERDGIIRRRKPSLGTGAMASSILAQFERVMRYIRDGRTAWPMI